jgi:hypothetical protein
MNPGDVDNTWVPRVDQDDARKLKDPPVDGAECKRPQAQGHRPLLRQESPPAFTNRFRGYTPSSTGRSEGT